MTKPILIFPAGMPKAIEFLETCKRENRSVIGASSLAFDPARERYETWAHLPYVTEPEFGAALEKLIAEHDIRRIFSPNIVVWNVLKQRLAAIRSDVELLNESPIDAGLASYRNALERARADMRLPLELANDAGRRAALSHVHRAALYRYVDTVPGMCDFEKTAALCEVARHAPKGDIVEIGSWWGKSAVILTHLARAYELGSVLCVDPWSPDNLIQNDEGGLVDSMVEHIDPQEALVIFQLSLIPCGVGHCNFLRLPSSSAAQQFRSSPRVSSEAFGETTYQGAISILHIDGNHSYEAVCDDIRSWCDLVRPGGWVIFDDYVWPFGTGPKIAADEFLEEHRASLSQAFVMGSALFVQLSR